MKLEKGKSGWKATDLIDFDGPRKLCVSTYKINGKLVTHAAVNTYNGAGYSHAFSFAGGGDFSEYTIVTQGARGTEKTVSDQHALAMQKLPEIEARARAHYAAIASMK